MRKLIEALPQVNSTLYARSGLLDQARQRTAGPGNRILKELALGELILADGHPEAAIPHLEKWSELTQASDLQDADIACDSLATAWTLLGSQSDAIKTLESCLNPRQFPSPIAPLGFWKLRLSAHLAKLYRQSGRVAEAQAIEARVRGLLAVGRQGFPLLQELNNQR
jgi:hypothetical protein